MKRFARLVPVLLLAVFLVPMVARSQGAQPAKPSPRALIAIYQVAPGKHLDFLRWLAANEAIDKEAGVPASVLYAHANGDSWDYLVVAPDLSDEQSAKVDEVAKRHGRKTGIAASLEFRTFISTHTDTFVHGPTTASALVAEASM
ncbi:MAG TPA: hypothetical protein VGV61_01495 [Thermoanaerobaculia bacterium]|jgi:hypothetical protein|nr:hypothetical protein [Thermoanaerobaculia bacterium]